MKLALLVLAACPAPLKPVQRPLRCDLVRDYMPTRTFLQSSRVVYLDTLSAEPEWGTGDARCTKLELAVRETFRGDNADGTRLQLVVQESVLDHPSPPNPWTAELNLQRGTPLMAFCPAGDLATTLLGSCRVLSYGLGAGMYMREVETKKLSVDAAVALLHPNCGATEESQAYFLLERYDVTKRGVGAALATLVGDPKCSPKSRRILRPRLLETISAQPALTARLIIRGVLATLSSEVTPLVDELLRMSIPDALDLEHGGKYTAAEVFGGDAKALEAATLFLTTYKGEVDISQLWAWLKLTTKRR